MDDRSPPSTDDEDAFFLNPFLESALDVLVILDPEGRVLDASPSTAAHLGYSRADLRAGTGFALVHPDDVTEVRRVLAEALHLPGASHSLRFRARHRDGRSRILEAHARALPARGAANRVVLSAHDITERAEGEARAARLEAALFRISETAATVAGLDELYPALHRIVGELMDARNFYVALLEPEGQRLRFPYFVDGADARPPEGLLAEGTLCHHMMQTGGSLRVRREDFERLRSEGRVRQVGTVSADWLGVPLMRAGEVFGAVVIQTYDEAGRYTEADRELLTFVTRHVANAIDRQQATEWLRESARRFRLLFDGNPLAMWVYDPATLRLLDVNDAALRQYGYTRDEFLDLTVDALNLPEEATTVRRRLTGLPSGAETSPIVWRHRRKNGTMLPVEISSRDLRLGSRRTRVVVGRDLTERHKAEEQLRRSEEQFRALIENAADLITVVGRDGRIRYQSPSIERVGGYRPEEVVGKNPGELIHADDRAAADRFFAAALARPGLTSSLRVRFRRRDGTFRVLEGQGHNRLDVQGVDGVVFNLRDVTDRELAEEALRQRQKLESLGVLAGGVAHDFNNLLGVILGQSTLALRRMPPGAPGRANVEKTIPVVERAADLAAKMLAYSGKGHFEVRPVDLGGLFQENRPLYDAALPKRVRLLLERAEGVPLVMADAGQVHQLLLSLLLNASEAIGERTGTVVVRTGVRRLSGAPAEEALWHYLGWPLAPGAYASLEVEDDGVGMDSETVSRIFDPFFTTKFVGRGLGLAAVLGTVRGHGGGIGVESVPGQGTRITVVFPVADGAGASPVPPGGGDTPPAV